MRRAFPILLLLLIATLLAVAGCGGGSSNSGASSTSSTSTSAGGSSSGSGTVEVAMKDISFAPSTVRVKVGQKITWTNDDSVQHDVQSTSGEKIKSSLFGKGGTFSFTPTTAGTIAYVCTVHPGMDGTIVVSK